MGLEYSLDEAEKRKYFCMWLDKVFVNITEKKKVSQSNQYHINLILLFTAVCFDTHGAVIRECI